MFTSSFACTSSPASAAMTSFAFMFDDVPDPVWKMSIGNWSSNSPLAMRSPAAAILSAFSLSRRPRSAFTRAAAALIRPDPRATETGMGSPETGKFSTALRVSVPQSSFGVVATPWSLDGAQPAEPQLGRPIAERLAHRIGEVGDEGPAQVATLGALAGIEALRALALGGSERAAAEALDSVLLAHTVFFGCLGPTGSPPDRGDPSVGRVLGLNLFAADAGDGVVGRDRSLAEADRDQRDLALVAGHVTRRVHARDGRVHGHRIDKDLALPMEIEPPVGDRAEVGVEAEEEDERFAVEPGGLAGPGVLDRDRLDRAVAVDLAHLGGSADPDVALALEPTRLIDGGFERPEPVAPVDERDREVGGVLQAERPVERGVAAADDDAVLALEDVLARDEVVEPAAFPVVDPLELELPRLEGAMAGRDDQRAREKPFTRLGRQREQLLAVL